MDGEIGWTGARSNRVSHEDKTWTSSQGGFPREAVNYRIAVEITTFNLTWNVLCFLCLFSPFPFLSLGLRSASRNSRQLPLNISTQCPISSPPICIADSLSYTIYFLIFPHMLPLLTKHGIDPQLQGRAKLPIGVPSHSWHHSGHLIYVK